MRFAAMASVILGWSASVFAQDAVWVETRFHRVHLRNGNFIDGKVNGVRDQDVLVDMAAGEMIIRKDSIDRIELIKMRSLGEKPKLDPPLKRPAATRVAVEGPKRRVREAVPPPLDPNMKSNIALIFSRLRIAARDQKPGLVQDLAAQEGAAPYLASLLPTLDEDTGAFVGQTLVRMKDPDANSYLVAALDSDKPHVRIRAIDLLGELGSEAVFPQLRRCMEDEVAVVRVAAMGALSRLADPDALRMIVALMGDSNATLRKAAISHSLTLGSRTGQMETVHEGLRLALGDVRAGDAISDLVWAAGRTGSKPLWSAVAAHLFDADPKVRGAAVEALTALAAPASTETVVQQMRSEDDKGVRLRLALTATALKASDPVPVLIDWLRSNDGDISDAAVKALQGITRQKFGRDYEKWDDWWQSVPKQPK